MTTIPSARAVTVALLLACSRASASGDGYAQEAICSPGDRACGKRAFERATAAFDAQRYDEAMSWYMAAQTAAPHPIIGFNLGLCYARSGQPSLAHAQFTKLLADPALVGELRERVRRELAVMGRRVARVSIEAGESHSLLEWDGQQVEVRSDDLIVDPGAHHVRLSSSDGTVLDQDVRLEPGERLKLRLMNRARVLDIVPLGQRLNSAASVVPEPTSMQPALPEAPVVHRTGVPPEWFCLVGGITVLLGAATIWSGVDVENAYSRYQEELPKLAQAEANERVADGHARERRTNVLLGLTAASATATTLLGLFWTNWHPDGARPGVSVIALPEGAGIYGTF